MNAMKDFKSNKGLNVNKQNKQNKLNTRKSRARGLGFKFQLIAPILGLTLFLSACSKLGLEESKAGEGKEVGEQITINHELGEAKVATNPERIVVFDYGLLDILDYLEVSVVGLPKSSLPSFLSKYQDESYGDVGTLKEPDFEKVFELKPDLILISSRTQGAYEELNKIAPTVYLAVDNSDYMKSVRENVSTLTKLVGKVDSGESELKKLEDQALNIQAKAEAKGENALILLANDGSLSVYGKDSRFGLIHHALGFAQADTGIEESTHGQNVTYEYILEKDPDHLFVIDRNQVVGGEVDASSVMNNEILSGIKATINNTVHYLDAEVWYITSGGLIGTGKMLDEIEKVLK